MLLCLSFFLQASESDLILKSTELKDYIDEFNANDEELYANIPNDKAWEFLKENIPLFDCPNTDFERTYYFRWWTYRKHIKRTSDGYVVTEFLPKVYWSGKHNTICCPVGHHFYEGRWLHDSRYLDDYAIFWFRKGGDPRDYSTWLADAIYNRYLVNGQKRLIIDLLDDLAENYYQWEKGRIIWGKYHMGLRDNGMFFSVDDRDGGEKSVGGHGFRPTLNSYMYADAMSISKIALLAGRENLAKKFRQKAEDLKTNVQRYLWDTEANFFKVLKENEDELVDVRELYGYSPWYFNLPDIKKGYETAWQQLMDQDSFYAPFGPTSTEQRHPGFEISYEGHECQWNGPSWPYATSITLTAMANVLNNYPQDIITREDYFDILKIYTNSHHLKRSNGKSVPWIDENLNPFTGEWISRTRLEKWENGTWFDGKGGKERGKDYNHSSYCDLIITGLIGLRPRMDTIVEVNPLVPQNQWDWFCLDNVLYHGHILTIVWDRDGTKYNMGSGLQVFADGKRIASSDFLERVEGVLVESGMN